MLRRFPISHHTKRVWAHGDKPANIRIPIRFLFGLKRLLVQWGFKKIQVNDETLSMQVGVDDILSVCSDRGTLQIAWRSAEWENWADLHNDAEFKTLRESCEHALSRATDKEGKGEWEDCGAVGLPTPAFSFWCTKWAHHSCHVERHRSDRREALHALPSNACVEYRFSLPSGDMDFSSRILCE
eukprot:9475882-Pyramimonas_sp.AAC.1